MNTQDTQKLQDELNETIKVEQSGQEEGSQSVEIHVQGFTLFAETMN